LYDARKYDAPFSEFRISVSAVANALHSHYQATRSLSTSTSFYPLSLQKAMEMASLAQWTNMTFSPSGKGILVTMENGLVLVLDSFEGNILHVFMSEGGSSSTDISLPTYPAAACYTSDDQSILCGNENGTLSCWDVTTGRLRRRLEGHTGSRVFCIQSNPKFAQFASACTNVALWLW
jgi:WD40 repeat protein